MTNNPILEELRVTRRKLLKESGGTLEGLVARLQEIQSKSGRQIVPPRQPTHSAGSAQASDSNACTPTSPAVEH